MRATIDAGETNDRAIEQAISLLSSRIVMGMKRYPSGHVTLTVRYGGAVVEHIEPSMSSWAPKDRDLLDAPIERRVGILQAVDKLREIAAVSMANHGFGRVTLRVCWSNQMIDSIEEIAVESHKIKPEYA